MRKLCLVSLVLLTTPGATALASPADRDRDRLPDRWERKHGLSLERADAHADPDRDRVDNRDELVEGTDPTGADTDRDRRGDGREDADGDGLVNSAEDRTGNDPSDSDSDDDGIRDADENAGTVRSYADGRLTIALATGGTLRAAVSEHTDVGCGSETEAELIQALEDWDGVHAASASDFGESMDDEHDFEDACPARWLAPGVAVREASLSDHAELGEVEFLVRR